MEIEYINKRDYSTKAFHMEKISGAIHKAMNAVGHGDEQNAQDVALSVYQTLVGRKENDVEYVPTIEEVQDSSRRNLWKVSSQRQQKLTYYIETKEPSNVNLIFLKNV